jgi:tetratricopeptide (TPR) repeat protein
VSREPRVATHWVDLGTTLRAMGRSDEALLAYAEAAGRGESSADFLYNVALLHHERGDLETARRLYADALHADPEDADIRLQAAQCCHDALDPDAALALLEPWPALTGLDAERLSRLALLLLNLGDGAGADAVLARLVADGVEALPPLARLRLAQLDERRNRVADATAGLAALRGREAELPADEIGLLEAQLAQRAGHHVDAMRGFAALAAACEDDHRRHLFLYPLAKSLRATGRVDESLACLDEAHAAQWLQLSRTFPEATRWPEPPLHILETAVDPADVAGWTDPHAPAAQESPVFVVGFPRSGTTLLEQVLDAHPALASMDEQPFLQQVIESMTGPGTRYPDRLAGLDAAALDALRARYLALCDRRVAGGLAGRRLVDKNPLNLLRLAGIRRLFPHAKVILALRDPRDVLLSCHLQHFRAPEFALLCRDLPTLARGYARIFAHAYAELPRLGLDVLELRYEDWVSDLPAATARLAEFLELPEDAAMRDPAARARQRGYISTPSYAQVIEAPHRRSIGGWRPYARWLETAKPALAPWLRRFGYDEAGE